MHSRTGRRRQAGFLLEGPRAIADALDRGVVFQELVVTEASESVAAEWQRAGRLDGRTAVYRATIAELAALADTTTPQGLLAVGSLPPLSLMALPAAPAGLILWLDAVQDPGNFGTLLRTLAAVGGTIALCGAGTVDPYNPKALRAAAGATFGLAVAAGVAPADALAWLDGHGVPVVALTAGAPNLFDATLPRGPLALVVGNEAAGLHAEIEARAALVVGLPMAPGIDSLSVAVAGSVALYALAHHLAPAPA
ncbi:MAG: TrmH family RNA methyltransferase [Gemmatimonadota bacterium]